MPNTALVLVGAIEPGPRSPLLDRSRRRPAPLLDLIPGPFELHHNADATFLVRPVGRK